MWIHTHNKADMEKKSLININELNNNPKINPNCINCACWFLFCPREIEWSKTLPNIPEIPHTLPNIIKYNIADVPINIPPFAAEYQSVGTLDVDK